MSLYSNMAGQSFVLPERPLEPPDCWQEETPSCQCCGCGQDVWSGEYTFDGLCPDCFKGMLFDEFTLQEIAKHLGYDVKLC